MPNLTVVNVTAASTLIFGGKGSSAAPIQLVNLDPANTVYFAYASNPAIGQAGVIPIGPFASMSFDGAVSVWGVTAAGLTAEVGVVPGGSNYSPGSLAISGPVTAEISGPVTVTSITEPVDIGTIAGDVDIASVSGNVNVVGQGGYIIPGQIAGIYGNAAPVTVLAGQTTLIVSQEVVGTYASLDFSFVGLFNTSAAAGSAMCAVISFIWQDSIGDVLGTDRISVCQGQTVTGSIPCLGSTVTITAFNPGTVGTLTFPVNDIFVDGSFRQVSKISFSTEAYGTPVFAGLQQLTPIAPAYVIDGWIVNLVNTTGLVVADLYMLLLPMNYGEVIGSFQVATDALSNNMVIIDLAYQVVGGVTPGAGNNGMVFNASGAIGSSPVDFVMPPSQCALIMKVSNVATSITCSILAKP